MTCTCLLAIKKTTAQQFKFFEPVQNFYFVESNGRPLNLETAYKPEGSPFFYSDYVRAEVLTMEGVAYKDVKLKFNVTERQIQYMSPKGNEMIVGLPIKSIRLLGIKRDEGSIEDVLLQTDKGALNSTEGAVFQVLDSGKIGLYRKIEINWRDEKKLYEASTTRHFERREIDYLVLPDSSYKKIEKNRAFITEVLKDKSKEIVQYIDSNKIKCKSGKDFREIIAYYNSLR